MPLWEIEINVVICYALLSMDYLMLSQCHGFSVFVQFNSKFTFTNILNVFDFIHVLNQGDS